MASGNQQQNSLPMDEVDRELINKLQTDFPITSRPFRDIGQGMGMSEDEVIKRLSRLQEIGIIRRIGASVSPQQVGYVSTLCGARVPQEKVDEFVEVVNRYPGVTHNYLREDKYNVWFTFIAPSMEHIEKCLDRIQQETGITEILNMPAKRVFKVRAQFEV